MLSDLKIICATVWKGKHGFSVIDNDIEPDDGRYRMISTEL